MGDLLLLERERELALLAELARGVRHGHGVAVVIDGEAGIGKTTVLAAARADAERAGLRVLGAQGRELEQDLPYGVAQQLFTGLAREPEGDMRERLFAGPAQRVHPLLVGETPEADGFALRHSLFWLLANVAADGPLLLVVDDAQWADRISLRFLSYAVERIDDLPILLVLAGRSPVRSVVELDSMAQRRTTVRLSLKALSAEACAVMVRTVCPEASADFIDGCTTGTQGNPLFLRQVVDEAARSLTVGTVPAFESLRFNDVGETVMRRLGSLEPEVQALAQAAAVVGEGGQLRHAAQVADLGMDVAQLHADALANVGLIRPGHVVRFIHPLVADALRATIPPGRRSVGHRQVARLLAHEGDAQRASTHLLHVAPAADAEVVQLLRSQARRSGSAGAADVAATMLRRALAEPPDARDRSAVLAELGEAELQSGEPEALSHLEEARRLAESGYDLERASRLLATAYAVHGPMAASADVLDAAIHALAHDQSDRAGRLRAELLAFAQLEHTATARTQAELRKAAKDCTGRTETERILLAADGYAHAIMWTAPAAEAAAELETAVEHGLIGDLDPDNPVVGLAMSGLVLAGAWTTAAHVIEQEVARARAKGRSRALAQAAAINSRLARLRGDLDRAETDARLAVGLSTDAYPTLLPYSLAVLVMSLTARGDLAAACQALTDHSAWGDVPPTTPAATLLLARASLHCALRDPQSAVADLDRLGGFVDARGDWPPAWIPDLVDVLRAAGRLDDAAKLAERHVADAERWAQPTDYAEALRSLAQARDGNDVELLEQALGCLEDGTSPLVRTKVLRDLGSALRRTNRRAEARPALLEALDLANSMRSAALVDQIRVELAACGVRPRRSAQTGVDSLTASELRIANLARDGLTNPEIAQSLFITRKTVEKHLASAYRKLNINTRAELADALGTGPSEIVRDRVHPEEHGRRNRGRTGAEQRT
jgi:DNA-binding CsgD family transcriptional regulator